MVLVSPAGCAPTISFNGGEVEEFQLQGHIRPTGALMRRGVGLPRTQRCYGAALQRIKKNPTTCAGASQGKSRWSVFYGKSVLDVMPL